MCHHTKNKTKIPFKKQRGTIILSTTVSMEEKQVIKIIKKVMPAVVSILITKHLDDLEKEFPGNMYPYIPTATGGKKLDIPEDMIDAKGNVQVGGGSGFIVSANGIIVTNKHVITETAAQYTVITNDGKKYNAIVLCRDPINDVAIIKIDATDMPTIALGKSEKTELGASVLAIGNALGIFKNTVSAGIVSGLSRSVVAQADPNSPPQEMRGLIQTDAAINPGNSGGPLVNSNGEVIGINAAIISGAQNIGLAIPINAAKRDLADLAQYGRVRRPFLGLRYLILDEKIAQKLGIPVTRGAYVTRESEHEEGVMEGSPAQKAGLQEKDIITRVNGKDITPEYTIQDALEPLVVGDIFEMTILRNKKTFRTGAILSERK